MLHGFERLVGGIQRKSSHGLTDLQIASKDEKVARVLSGHVGHAANLALAPKKLVVVERGHLVEVNGIDGDDSALAQAGQCGDHHLATGSEGNCAIESGWGLCFFAAYPGRPQRLGGLAVRLTARADIDLAAPRLKDV